MATLPLTVLQVAYPFAPVGPDAVGGAEQVLSALDHALVRRGHRSIVVAQAGSVTAGTLVPVPITTGTIDAAARARAHAAHRAAIADALDRYPVDVVHLHGIDFDATLPPPGPPALVTLHLPPGWYAADALPPARPRTWCNPVSRAQAADCPRHPAILEPIANGVPIAALRSTVRRRGYAVALGRICPEKNFAAALDAGTRAGVPVLLAGQVFPYPEHEAYFRQEIAPRLRDGHRWLGPVGFARKRRLLAGARALLSASLAPETSSLVAMEALAAGTPVIAYPSGALAEIVLDGETGVLVADVAAMAAALGDVGRIDPERCRADAAARFSDARMAEDYIALYRRLMAHG